MYFGRNYYRGSGRCSSNCYLGGADVDNIQLWEKVLSNGDVKSIYQEPLTGKVLYATQHFGGSDDKTDSEGKLDDLFVITKVYDGSSSGASVNPYIGLRYGDWAKPVVATAISDNKLEANVLDFRIYNRNKDKQYYSLTSAVSSASSGNTIEVWPGKYKENVAVNTRVNILGSGTSRTIIDGR